MTVQQGQSAIAGNASASPGSVAALLTPGAENLAGGASVSANNPLTPYSYSQRGVVSVFEWGPLALGGVGAWASVALANNVDLQIEGTFGSNGAVVIEGTSDGANVEPLVDSTGASLRVTAKGLKSVATKPLQIRPNVTSGDGTTNLTITVVARPTII